MLKCKCNVPTVQYSLNLTNFSLMFVIVSSFKWFLAYFSMLMLYVASNPLELISHVNIVEVLNLLLAPKAEPTFVIISCVMRSILHV